MGAGVLLAGLFLTGNRDLPASVIVLGGVLVLLLTGLLRFQ